MSKRFEEPSVASSVFEATMSEEKRAESKQSESSVDSRLKARKRRQEEAKEEVHKKRQLRARKDPNAEYDPGSDEEGSSRTTKSGKAGTVRRGGNKNGKASKKVQEVQDSSDDETDSCFKMTQVYVKAEVAATKPGAMLAPGWQNQIPEMTEMEKWERLYQYFYHFNLDLTQDPDKDWYKAQRKVKGKKKMSRGDALVEGWTVFARKCKSRMITLIIMSEGWPDHTADSDPWKTTLQRDTYARLAHLLPPPVNFYEETSLAKYPNPVNLADLKKALQNDTLQRMQEHHDARNLLTLTKPKEGTVWSTVTSMRHSPRLFARFALLTILCCSGTKVDTALDRIFKVIKKEATFGK